MGRGRRAMMDRPTPDSPERNKALVRELVESVYAGRVERLDALVSAEYTDHSRWRTRDGLRDVLTQFLRVYPYRECVVEDAIAEGDRVAARLRCDYARSAKPASHDKTVRATVVFRIADGKVVEHWGHSDSFY